MGHDASGGRCRRRGCARRIVGRGLCAEHYGRWLLETDTLELSDDTEPAPPPTVWHTPEHPVSRPAAG